jgi:hypothetical protein
LPKVLESPGQGVMEYWSVEKRGINPMVITAKLQYSNTPKLIEMPGCLNFRHFIHFEF